MERLDKITHLTAQMSHDIDNKVEKNNFNLQDHMDKITTIVHVLPSVTGKEIQKKL